jgi:hypothetical protein
MDLPDGALPDRPAKRFLLGFCAAGLVAFIVVVWESDSLRKSIISASAAALIIGVPAGLLSAFGKKLLRCILALATEIISNP